MAALVAESCIWQRQLLSNGQWEALPFNLDAAFASGTDKHTHTMSHGENVVVCFATMTLASGEKIRRLSARETPRCMYQYVEQGAWWENYTTDESEVLRMAEDAGRRKVVLYTGPDCVAVEVDVVAKVQLHQVTRERAMVRVAPKWTFSAAPDARAAPAAATSRAPLQASCPTQLSAAESAAVVVRNAKVPAAFHDEDRCAICLDGFGSSGGVQLDACGPHYFHPSCIETQLVRAGKCPVCCVHYIVSTGSQPLGGTMTVHTYPAGQLPLQSHESVGTIVIVYQIPSGVQTAEHPHPGTRFHGTCRHAYLPDTPEGREVLALLRVCFQRRHTFTVGRSLTTGMDNVVTWNGVHHKTNTHGGTAYFGWPDPSYLWRVKEELKAKGIGGAA